jgi:hypothetical protein
MVPVLEESWRAISISLSRGDPDYTPYSEQPESIRRQWDALEQFLLQLGDGRQVYVTGRFYGSPIGLETFVSKQTKSYWVGTCRICDRVQAHELLAANPTEWYDFVITEAAPSSALAVRFVEVPRKRHFFEHMLGCCEKIFCAIEENNDRDAIDLLCTKRDLKMILNTFGQVTNRCGLRFAPQKEHLY